MPWNVALQSSEMFSGLECVKVQKHPEILKRLPFVWKNNECLRLFRTLGNTKEEKPNGGEKKYREENIFMTELLELFTLLLPREVSTPAKPIEWNFLVSSSRSFCSIFFPTFCYRRRRGLVPMPLRRNVCEVLCWAFFLYLSLKFGFLGARRTTQHKEGIHRSGFRYST